MEKAIIWKNRRTEILKQLGNKINSIGHVHELPPIESLPPIPEDFEELDLDQQRSRFIQVIKNCALGEYSQHLLPHWSATHAGRIRFKIPSGLDRSIKEDISKFTHFLRYIIESRVHISEMLAKKINLGLVARSVAIVFRDFLNQDFPKIVESLFANADSFRRLDEDSAPLTADLKILSVTLEKILVKEMVGGEIITYLDRPEIHQQLATSFIPPLFAKCRQAGMKHYNDFLEEFLYKGTVDSDRQHEFMIWDLSISKRYSAADFGHYDREFFVDLPFDQRFVIIADLIPSAWRNGMVSTLYHTRKIISILFSETRKPFSLPYTSIKGLSAENQLEVVKEKNEYAGQALIEKIDSVFNIQEFYILMYEMIFNPSSLWLANFVDAVEEISKLEIDESFEDHVNRMFTNSFYVRCQKVKENFDLIKLKLYNYSLFDKVLPLDQRFVDYIEAEGSEVNDENEPPTGSELKLSDEPLPLPFLESIGIEFNDAILLKCLVPPPVQEHLNRLLRLRIALVRADLLLLKKRYESPKAFLNRQEQVFIAFVQNFLSRYNFFVFGIVCEQQWNTFKATTPNIKSISTITEAQRLLLRNINSSAGLYSRSHNFSVYLNQVLQLVNCYCDDDGEMTFDEAADQFYAIYKSMRETVCSKENECLDKMSYEVFRVPSLVRMSEVEKVEMDPRQGLEPTTNLAAATSTMRRSISLMSVQRRI